jgi:hypothetical protein
MPNLDGSLEKCRDHSTDILLLTETWHNPDSICVQCLRADGFTVVERTRPRLRQDTLTCNHGGELAATPFGLRLTAINLRLTLMTFEADWPSACVKVDVGPSSCCLCIDLGRPPSHPNSVTNSLMQSITWLPYQSLS